MDDVVVTATRSEENIKNIPVKVEVIDSQTVELTIGGTITEQLKKNSSIGVIEYPGALAGIGIRGFRPEFSGITKHSLVLINGRPAGATNLATILSCNIERIEVLKGPASSLYGGEAMGGVVNIITKKHTDELTGMAEIGFGSFETNFMFYRRTREQATEYSTGERSSCCCEYTQVNSEKSVVQLSRVWLLLRVSLVKVTGHYAGHGMGIAY